MTYAIPKEMLDAGAEAAEEHEGEIPEVIAAEVYTAMEKVRQFFVTDVCGGVQ